MPRAGTSAPAESVDVDVAVEVSFGSDRGHRPSGTDPDRRIGRRPQHLTAVLAGVAVLLVGLVLWPPAMSDTRSDAADLPSVAGWPARGSLAFDPDLARSAAASWRSAGRGAGITAPGPDIGVVFLDDQDGALTAVLHSRAPDGQLLVAVGRAEEPGGVGASLQILDAVPVRDDPPWLTLPGGEHPRLLVAPDLPQQAALVLRRDDGRWGRLTIGADGVSAPVRGLGDEPPLVGVLEGGRPPRALLDVQAVSATSPLPVPAPVTVSDPAWGRATGLTPEEVDAALTVRAALAPTSDPIAVIAEARIRDGRAVLAEIARPSGVEHVLVATGADGVPRPAGARRVNDSLALGLLPREEGRWLVLAGAGPEVERFEVRTPGGRTLIGGTGSAAVVVPSPAPTGVVVIGWRSDGSQVDRVSLPLAPQGARQAA